MSNKENPTENTEESSVISAGGISKEEPNESKTHIEVIGGIQVIVKKKKKGNSSGKAKSQTEEQPKQEKKNQTKVEVVETPIKNAIIITSVSYGSRLTERDVLDIFSNLPISKVHDKGNYFIVEFVNEGDDSQAIKKNQTEFGQHLRLLVDKYQTSQEDPNTDYKPFYDNSNISRISSRDSLRSDQPSRQEWDKRGDNRFKRERRNNDFKAGSYPINDRKPQNMFQFGVKKQVEMNPSK